MEKPLVDVLMPVFRPDHEFLKEALESLQAQTYCNWKALIHDDPSDTDALETINPFLSDPRITFRKSNTRLGIGGNWNACFEATSAPIVAYLFQDDMWSPDYLKTAVRILAEYPHIGFVAMGHRYSFEMNDALKRKGFDHLQILKKQHFPHGVVEGKSFLFKWLIRGFWPNLIGEPDFAVMRREVMNIAGPFHAAMQQLLDTEYWTRMLEITNLYNETADMGSFRVHGAAATARNTAEQNGVFDRLAIISRFFKKGSLPMRLAALFAFTMQISRMIRHATMNPVLALGVIKSTFTRLRQ